MQFRDDLVLVVSMTVLMVAVGVALWRPGQRQRLAFAALGLVGTAVTLLIHLGDYMIAD